MPPNRIRNELGKIRRSMVIMNFGPGAIVDFRADGAPVSAVIAGLEEWDSSFWPAGLQNEQVVYEERLQRLLGVGGFRLPPVPDDKPKDRYGNYDKRSLVAVRFPSWLQCPRCDRIAPYYRWAADPGREYHRYCHSCSAKSPGQKKVFVIPVRFVLACEAGHLDEFPWHFWVGHTPECNRNNDFLTLRAEHPGLSGLILRCPECNASNTMDRIFSADTWKSFRCNGKRPWLRSDDASCSLNPRALQRGASNLYFPVQESALSIPPWSDRLQDALGIYWNPIIEQHPENRALFIRSLAESPSFRLTLEDLNLTPEELARRIEDRVTKYQSDAILNIRGEEYRQFVSGSSPRPEEKTEFEIRDVSVPKRLKDYFEHIVRVVRLREVLVLKGFTRINPPDAQNSQNISPIFIRDPRWLPAIEVRGEGIFMTFSSARLERWQQQKEIQERVEKVRTTWNDEWTIRYGNSDPKPHISPRFLLIHTFAHALMRQLTLDCGYSSASLRERLYIGDEGEKMAGLLVYTATSDSDGTLGGLQRQGESERILPTVLSAIKDMVWCSSDPLCIQGMISAPENHSYAACHACCLAPETSCEQYNRFLDRAMLVGTPERPDAGYFTSLLGE